MSPSSTPPLRPEVVRLGLNWPLLLASIVVLALVAGAGYLRYQSQLRQCEAALLDRASELEKSEQWADAANYLYRYLQVRPAEMAVWPRLATSYGKAAKEDPRLSQRAIELYHRALGYLDRQEDSAADEKRTELKTALANLLLSVGMVSEAEKEVAPWDPEGKPADYRRSTRAKTYLRTMALSAYWKARTGGIDSKQEALIALKDALDVFPDDFELAVYMAELYRDQQTQLPDGWKRLSPRQRSQEADRIVNAAVEAPENDQNGLAYLARSQYRSRYGLAGADADIQKAVQLQPDNFKILLAAGWQAIRSGQKSGASPGGDRDGQLRQAAKHFQQAIELQPTNPRGYVGLGYARMQQGRVDLACKAWRNGIREAKGDTVELDRRLATALIRTGKLDEAQTVINQQLRPDVERFLRTRAPSERTAALVQAGVDVLDAEIWLAKRQPHEAIDGCRSAGDTRTTGGVAGVLRILRDMPVSPQSTAVKIDALDVLGRARASMKQYAEAAVAYQQLLQLSPSSPRYTQLAMRMWQLAGDPVRARRLYQDLRTRMQSAATTTPADWLWLAQAALDVQLRRPVDQRDWTNYQQAFDQASRQLDKASQWQLQLLAASQVLASGTPEARGQAAQLLANAERLAPDSPSLWSQLTLRYQQLGRSKDADRGLAQYARLATDPLAHQLLKCRLLTMRGQLPQARQLLAQARQQATDRQREAVLRETLRVDMAAGELAAVRSDLEQLYKLVPQDLEVVRQLAELALQAGDDAAVLRFEDQLTRIEGDEGIWWRYIRARRFLADTGSDHTDEIAQLQGEIEKIRPKWPSGILLKAGLLVRQNRLEDAIRAYQQAIQLGANGVLTYERLIRLLVQVGRLSEADQYLSQMQSLTAVPGVWSDTANSLSVSLAAQLEQPTEALRRARQWVKDQPDDATARIWLGQVLALNGKDDEAERVLSEATKLAGKDARTWNALFAFYISRDKSAAQRTLQAMAEKADLSAPARALALARGYQLLQDMDQAAQAYRKAIELDPENIEPRLRLASLLALSDVAAAERQIQQALKQQPDSIPARRMLAALRVAQGSDQAWREVQQVLGADDQNPLIADANRRWQARLLARVGGTENLAKARGALESLVLKNPSAAPADRLLLAQVYQAEGQTDAARQQYRALVAPSNPNPAHLAIYIDFLLRQADPADQKTADKALGQLDRLTAGGPSQPRFAYIVLRARWLKQTGKPALVTALVDAYAASRLPSAVTDPQKAQLYSRVGGLYASLRMYKQAEPWLRKAVSVAPQTFAALAGTLAAQSQHDEAIQLCLDHAPPTLTPQFVGALMSVLTVNNPAPAVLTKAEPLLEKAVADNPDNASVMFSVGTIRAMQEQYEQSIELFTKANRLQPKQVLTLNNLATLLAELPGREKEAMNYIDQAIEIAGEQPFLLDTKGIILLQSGQIQQAVEALQRAAVGATVDPRFYLHLAVALDRSGDRDKAGKALENALSGGLESTILTGSDRTWLDQLRSRSRLPGGT